MRSAALITVLCCVVAMAACGGSSNSCNPDPGCLYSIAVECSPTTIQSGGTSQCSYIPDCYGKVCAVVTVSWSASAGSININGLFTAPETNTGLQVTITGTAQGSSNLVATTIVTVNP